MTLSMWLDLTIIAIGLVGYYLGKSVGRQEGYERGYLAGHRHGMRHWNRLMEQRRIADGQDRLVKVWR